MIRDVRQTGRKRTPAKASSPRASTTSGGGAPTSEATEARLVRNGEPGDHLETLGAVIANATTISMAVAFLKSRRLDKVIANLRARLEVGASIEMFVGCDFCLTEPDALKDLLALSEMHTSLEVFLAKADPRSTFHPKLYLGVDAGGAQMLMGSANMTGGALTTNEEISLCWRLAPDDELLNQLKDVFSTYRTMKRFEQLDEILLDQYRRQFKTAQDAKRRIEKEIAAADDAMFDLSTLTSLHAEFIRDRDEAALLEKRRSDRKLARSVQRKISRMASLPSLSRKARSEFETLFRDLVTWGDGHRHLWHSGDIHRQGHKALTQPRKTIELFHLAEAAAKLPPSIGYARMREPARAISGVGINTVSEILCTLAPGRYAVFNGNTAAALRTIGAEPPKTVTLFSPEAYGRVCSIVEAVRRRIGAHDLSDTDAFLNWIYQTKVKIRT